MIRILLFTLLLIVSLFFIGCKNKNEKTVTTTNTTIINTVNTEDNRLSDNVSSDEELVKTLINAASSGDIEIVKSLIKNGIDVNEEDINDVDGVSEIALMAASRKGNLEMVKLLLENGADINILNDIGFTPLMISVSNGHTDIVKFLIEAGADINAYNLENMNAFDFAEPIELQELLAANGANVNMPDMGGYTPLMYAAMNGNIESVKKILKYGVIDEDNNALIFAGMAGHNDIVKLFTQAGAEISFSDAILIGDLEKTKSFIDKGIDVNLVYDRDKYKTDSDINDCQVNCSRATFPPLMLAAESGYPAIIKLLLESGANINITEGHSNHNSTALLIASRNGHAEIVQLLIDADADLNTSDSADRTIVIWATINNHIETVKLLIKNKANLDAVTKYKSSALIHAVQDERFEIAKLLLEAGVNVNIKTSQGMTALAIVFREARQGDEKTRKLRADLIKPLIEAGADVNVSNKDGRTPLMSASSGGNIEMVKLLIDNGADINAKDDMGRTALRYATLNGKTEVANLLKKAGAKE